MLLAEGMEEPKVVKDAVQEYKNEMDLIAGFMQECIEIDYNSTDTVPANVLFQIYSKWAHANNEYEMSSKKFFNELTKKGIFYKNIRLTDNAIELKGHQYSITDFK